MCWYMLWKPLRLCGGNFIHVTIRYNYRPINSHVMLIYIIQWNSNKYGHARSFDQILSYRHCVHRHSLKIGIHIDLNSVFKHKIWGSVQIRTNTKNWWSNTVFELVIGQRPWWCDFVSISVPNHYIGYKTYDPCLNIFCDKIMNTCLYKCSYTIHRSTKKILTKYLHFNQRRFF